MSHKLYLDVTSPEGTTLDPVKMEGFATAEVANISAKLLKGSGMSDVRKFASAMGVKVEMRHGHFGSVVDAAVID